MKGENVKKSFFLKNLLRFTSWKKLAAVFQGRLSNQGYIIIFLQSKGGILSKTVDYINELKLHNARMVESIKDNERLQIDTELLRQQVDDLRQENALLRAQLQQHGVELATGGPSA